MWNGLEPPKRGEERYRHDSKLLAPTLDSIPIERTEPTPERRQTARLEPVRSEAGTGIPRAGSEGALPCGGGGRSRRRLPPPSLAGLPAKECVRTAVQPRPRRTSPRSGPSRRLRLHRFPRVVGPPLCDVAMPGAGQLPHRASRGMRVLRARLPWCPSRTTRRSRRWSRPRPRSSSKPAAVSSTPPSSLHSPSPASGSSVRAPRAAPRETAAVRARREARRRQLWRTPRSRLLGDEFGSSVAPELLTIRREVDPIGGKLGRCRSPAQTPSKV
jgi:hypothetical protein